MEPPEAREERSLEPEEIKSEAGRLFNEFKEVLVKMPEFQAAAAEAVLTRIPLVFSREGFNYMVGFSDDGLFVLTRRRENNMDYPERVEIALLDKADSMFQAEIERARDDPGSSLVFTHEIIRANMPNYVAFSGPTYYLAEKREDRPLPIQNKTTVLLQIEKVLSELKGNSGS